MKKSMRTTVLVTMALSLFFSVGWAQTIDRNEIIREMGEPVLSGEIYSMHPQVYGTPFFKDEWSGGNIYLANGRVASGMLKYNGFTDDLYWFDPVRNTSIILDKAILKGFTLTDATGSDTLVFRKTDLIPTAGKECVFVQVLYEGNFSLYVLRSIEERGKRVVTRNNRRVELPNLVAAPSYYIDIPGKGLVQVRQMRKSFLFNLVPEQREVIREALSGHPGRFSTEASLVAAIKAVDKI
jgi:hypothetical protein